VQAHHQKFSIVENLGKILENPGKIREKVGIICENHYKIPGNLAKMSTNVLLFGKNGVLFGSQAKTVLMWKYSHKKWSNNISGKFWNFGQKSFAIPNTLPAPTPMAAKS